MEAASTMEATLKNISMRCMLLLHSGLWLDHDRVPLYAIFIALDFQNFRQRKPTRDCDYSSVSRFNFRDCYRVRRAHDVCEGFHACGSRRNYYPEFFGACFLYPARKSFFALFFWRVLGAASSIPKPAYRFLASDIRSSFRNDIVDPDFPNLLPAVSNPSHSDWFAYIPRHAMVEMRTTFPSAV